MEQLNKKIQSIFQFMARIPNDKLLHSFYGTLVYISFSIISPLLAIYIVLLVAVAKEVRDQYVYSGFDVIDILATIFIPLILFSKDALL